VKLRLRACWTTQAPDGFEGAPGKVNAPAAELDEEEHVEAAQRDRLDREEVAGEQARRLAAQKGRPAHRVTARGWLEPSGGKQPPYRARRDAEVELEQLSGDPLIAPSRVLARKPQHQFPQHLARRWTAAFALPERPPPAHELAMPAQQRRWCDQEPVPAPVREQSRERRDERTIGGSRGRCC
jgi:hypothetical protein